MYGWLKIVGTRLKRNQMIWLDIKAKATRFTPLVTHLQQVAMVAEKQQNWCKCRNSTIWYYAYIGKAHPEFQRRLIGDTESVTALRAKSPPVCLFRCLIKQFDQH